jgi:vacuolar-type H+-ATPase subunit I/STV1
MLLSLFDVISFIRLLAGATLHNIIELSIRIMSLDPTNSNIRKRNLCFRMFSK